MCVCVSMSNDNDDNAFVVEKQWKERMIFACFFSVS